MKSSADDRVRALIHEVLGQKLPDPFATTGGVERYRVGDGIVHVHSATGAVWIANDALWRLPSISAAGLKPLHRELPSGGATRWLLELASRFCAPTTAGVTVNAEPGWSDGTRLVVWTRDTDTRDTYVLDRADSVTLTLTAPRFGLDAVPICGPGCGLVHRAAPMVNGSA